MNVSGQRFSALTCSSLECGDRSAANSDGGALSCGDNVGRTEMGTSLESHYISDSDLITSNPVTDSYIGTPLISNVLHRASPNVSAIPIRISAATSSLFVWQPAAWPTPGRMLARPPNARTVLAWLVQSLDVVCSDANASFSCPRASLHFLELISVLAPFEY